MGAERHDGLAIPGRVVLAHEQPFTVGSLHVDPPRRQVGSNGHSETVEPRVMQVLVALRRAGGAIVTRDDLLEWCWNGRIVGDDAINRVLSKLRRLAAGPGSGSFGIETIPRVGYRIHGQDVPAVAESAAPARPDRWPSLDRRGAIAAMAAATAVAALGITAYSASRDGIPAEARALYERARAMESVSTGVTGDLVIPYAREAVRIAPHFGDAWGLLALAYRSELQDSPDKRAELEPRIDEAVANARRFSPGNADAEAALLLRDRHFGNWARMEPVYRALLARHRDYPLGHHLLGTLLMDVGRWNDAAEAVRSARRFDPVAPVLSYKLIVALWGAGRISEAEDEIAAAMLRWPRHGAIWQTRIKLLAMSGRTEEALALLADRAGHPQDESGFFAEDMRLIATALHTGSEHDRSAAIAVIRSGEPLLARAIYAAALGEPSLSLDMLDGIFLRRGRWARKDQQPAISTHPLFQPHARLLWRERRFDSLLDQLGLEYYWRATGSRPDYRRSS